MRPSLGAALLAGLGAGVFGSLPEAAALVPIAKRVEPRRDAAWRAEAHAQWKEFVLRAADL